MDIREPQAFERRTLLCVTGLTPQIITETLYALAVRPATPFVPTAIHVVTTRTGAEQAQLSLLYPAHPGEGHFYRLCADYGLDPAAIRWHFHSIGADAGTALDDIRSEADNVAAADTIARVVRELTADPNAAVHASIAGGRKTMGFFLGYAMSLFGRPQDRLSHVLVSQPFESHQQFYFPPRQPVRLEVGRDGDKRLVSTDTAYITLADIPFVRLRGNLGSELLSDGASYSETVQRAQANLEPVELVLDLNQHRIRVGSTVMTLDTANFAFYLWFARRAQAGLPGLHWSNADQNEFLRVYQPLVGEHSIEYERAEEALRQGMTQEYFEQRLSKLNTRLKHTLGPGPAAPYCIVTDGVVPGTRYRRKQLKLTPAQIRFETIS